MIDSHHGWNASYKPQFIGFVISLLLTVGTYRIVTHYELTGNLSSCGRFVDSGFCKPSRSSFYSSLRFRIEAALGHDHISLYGACRCDRHRRQPVDYGKPELRPDAKMEHMH